MSRTLYILVVFYLILAVFTYNNGSAGVAAAIDADGIAKLAGLLESFQTQLNSIEVQLKAIQVSVDQKMTFDDSRCALLDITEAIRGHKFKLGEEKLLELTDKSKITNIVHDVYADSSGNAEKILGFAKALKDSDLKIRVFSALRDEMHSRGHSDPYQFITLVEAMERELTRQRTATPDMKAKAQAVIDGTVADVKLTSINIFKTAMLTDKYKDTAEIQNLANAIIGFRNDLSNEIMERVVDSVFGVVAAGRILENISSHKHIPQVITGLTAVYNRFNFAGNLNNEATLDLAQHLHNLQEREDYANINKKLKSEVDKVVQQLPLCARNIFFQKHICFWNKGSSEYMYAASTSISHDAERRSIYTWYPGDAKTGSHWYAEKMGDSFFFKNRDYADEYMYAALIDHNKDMRLVLNWIPGNNTDPQSAWGVELDGDFCYIKSTHFNEYLFASAVRYDQLNSYVFTWKPGTSVRSAEFQWQIRHCSQAET